MVASVRWLDIQVTNFLPKLRIIWKQNFYPPQMLRYNVAFGASICSTAMRILVHCTRCLQELEQKGVIAKDGSFDSSVVTFLADFGDQFVARGTQRS